MLKAIIPAAALLVLALPTDVDAYGAVHYGYTHVGPYGAYHVGGTALAGPYGYGGIRSGYGYGGYGQYGGYRGYSDYRYAPSYGYGGYHYRYIR